MRHWTICGKPFAAIKCSTSCARVPASWHRPLDSGAGKNILYLEDITVSFDGFKALNDLTMYIKTGDCVVLSARTAPASPP